MSGRTIIVFARAPVRGAVKTRLSQQVGDDEALAIYRRLGSHTVDVARSVPGCRVVVCYTPKNEQTLMNEWLGNGVAFRPQSNGDLGDRLDAATVEAFAEGANAVVVIGTDCPDLDASLIEDAYAHLQRSDVVLGPAVDGGYYLIALRKPESALFRGIPWSTPHTLTATVDAANARGLRVVLLEWRNDIDTAQDWSEWGQRASVGGGARSFDLAHALAMPFEKSMERFAVLRANNAGTHVAEET